MRFLWANIIAACTRSQIVIRKSYIQSPRSFRCVIVRDFVAPAYRSPPDRAKGHRPLDSIPLDELETMKYNPFMLAMIKRILRLIS